MKKKLIIANWKMNGNIVSNSKLLLSIVKFSNRLNNTEVVICPPFIYLHQVKEYIVGTSLKLGAQNVSANDNGAYTGEVSVEMLYENQCRYVIVGHSERRTFHHESEIQIANKIIKVVTAGMTPVFCLGESLEQRERSLAKAVIIKQLDDVINVVGHNMFKSVVIAYEPIWAIGTGKTATIEQAQEIHSIIRKHLAKLSPPLVKKVSILYGGSVNESNAHKLIKQKDIDGFLVGGASLKAESFKEICTSNV
jgi:triosephosphate isomerase